MDFRVPRPFLKRRQRNLDGKLHMVRVATRGIVQPAEFRFAESLITLH